MNVMSLFISFVAMLVIGFFVIGFTDSVVAPDAGTAAGQQYTNLSQATGIASTGIYSVMLLLIVAMVFGSILYLRGMIK